MARGKYRHDDWVKEQFVKENMINKNKPFISEEALKIFEENIDKAFDNHLKIEEERKRKQEELELIESQRISDLSCPSCKSKEKQLNQITTNNGIIGNGYRMKIHDEYYICLGCGIHYTDVFKLKNNLL